MILTGSLRSLSALLWLLSAVVLTAGISAPSAKAADEAAEAAVDTRAAEDFIDTLAEETLAVLQNGDISETERQEQFTALLEKGVNTDYVSRFVLGRGWRQATEEQRREFVSLFKRFLLANLTDRLTGEYENETFVVRTSVPSGRRDVLVRSEIQRQSGPALPIEWRVRMFDDRWQIIDIKAEGISLAITQREEYSSVLQREGVEGLITALRGQVKALENGKEAALAESL